MPRGTKAKMMQFQIVLRDITPKIWRKIQVPSDYNFQQLHIAIQDAMGWFDCHLHEFILQDNENISKTFSIGLLDEEMDLEEDDGMRDETNYLIKDYFRVKNTKILYNYDFGDQWEHDIIYEGVINAKVAKPICIDGANPCPPEDAGGQSGYREFLKVMKNPNDKQHEEMSEWYRTQRTGCNGKSFVPGKFNKNRIRFRKAKKTDNY